MWTWERYQSKAAGKQREDVAAHPSVRGRLSVKQTVDDARDARLPVDRDQLVDQRNEDCSLTGRLDLEHFVRGRLHDVADRPEEASACRLDTQADEVRVGVVRDGVELLAGRQQFAALQSDGLLPALRKIQPRRAAGDRSRRGAGSGTPWETAEPLHRRRSRLPPRSACRGEGIQGRRDTGSGRVRPEARGPCRGCRRPRARECSRPRRRAHGRRH